MTILFSKDISETAAELEANNIIVNPSSALQISNLQKSSLTPTVWTSIVTALPSNSYPLMTSYIRVNYKGTVAQTHNFNIDTFVPELLSVDLDVSGFHYNETMGNIIMNFSRGLIERSDEFISRYMTITPSESLKVLSLSRTYEDEKIWNGIISVSGEVEYTNASIEIDYKGDVFSFTNLNIDTIIPRLIDISMGISEFNYNNTSTELNIEFTRSLIENANDLITNNVTILSLIHI